VPPHTAQLTVAVAAYERPESLTRCLAAILEGTVLPAQLVIVDQSRDERVGRVVAALERGPVQVDYVRQPRLGLAASRNAAVARARLPVIAFTDDDCVPAPDWVAVGERLLDLRDPFAALSGRVLALGPPSPHTFAVSLREGLVRRDHQARAIPWDVGTGGNFVAKREWLQAVGGFDERLGAGAPGKAAEDADLIYRLLRKGATLRYEPDAVVFHERQTPGQRLSSRGTYGFGIGAFCALWVARGDGYPGYLLTRWAWRQGRGMLSGMARGDWFLVRQRVRGLLGGMQGLWWGLAHAHGDAWRGAGTSRAGHTARGPASSRGQGE